MSGDASEASVPADADFWTLIELSWNGSARRWYTSALDEQVLALPSTPPARWMPKPEMEVDFGKQTGLLREGATKITLAADAWLSAFAGEDAQAPTAVRIVELKKDPNSADQYRWRFVGRVARSYTNPDNKPGLVRLECLNIKDELETAVGATADLQCSNTFGGPGCFVNLVPITGTGTITDIDSVVATITGLASITDPLKGKWWQRGYIQRDGVRISIRDWDQSDPGRFVLVRPAPIAWVGLPVSVTPGCDLLEATCRNRHNNIVHFNGRGLRMPEYNPTIEQAPA